ncbi:hypothetical protein [Dyella halodurans]|uniref:Uncharacterized protein n=1 Tax=Dyella halodurans TaxID=1920171 RepID=A0ABV9BZA2_9GAMM|nr:hypothetical protein [Dyella halodurans]
MRIIRLAAKAARQGQGTAKALAGSFHQVMGLLVHLILEDGSDKK